MPKVSLSMATGAYDHVRDLVTGRVQPEGIDLMAMELPIEDIFFRMHSFLEWDIAEFSLAKYFSLTGSGDAPFRAIPVFPSRMFRHSSFYVSTAAKIDSAADLAGKRVGIPEWSQTAGVYARAMLQHQHGMSLADICWVQGGVNEPGRQEKVSLNLPAGVKVVRVSDRSLSEMLLAGDLDAIISAREPEPFVDGDARLQRLWPEYQTAEEAYFRETGIFPIMHVIVVKNEVLERYPWAATNLLRAFEQAKENSMRRLATVVNSPVPMPWTYAFLNKAKSLLGEDPFAYRVEGNLRTLQAFAAFCCEQGITERPVTVEELFPREVVRVAKV
jgi:4,5-dihydroxyphthalate decarboxylase